jgi:hypothetical protein
MLSCAASQLFWRLTDVLLIAFLPEELILHRDSVHLPSLTQGMSERLDWAATFTRPEAKHDSRLIDKVAVAESVGTLASGKLQLNNPVDLFQPGVKPARLFGARVWNDNPADFVLLQ